MWGGWSYLSYLPTPSVEPMGSGIKVEGIPMFGLVRNSRESDVFDSFHCEVSFPNQVIECATMSIASYNQECRGGAITEC